MRLVVVKGDLEEVFEYPLPGFSLGVWRDRYTELLDQRLNVHWHRDLELDFVVAGQVDFYLEGQLVQLKAGEGLFINRNTLHVAYGSLDADLQVLVFEPEVMGRIDSRIYQRYFADWLASEMAGFKITGDAAFGVETLASLQAICQLPETEDYELAAIGHLSRLWPFLRNYQQQISHEIFSKQNQHEANTKAILQYIHQHYAENITIEAIIAAVKISRAECFRCFKSLTRQKPKEYINEYRLLKASQLLVSTKQGVAEIGASCGFQSNSYFGKCFKEKFSVTPLQYRKMKKMLG